MKVMMIAALALVSSVSFAHGRHHHHAHRAVGLTPVMPHCSNAGDETTRPVFNAAGELVGYECVQDNRGGNGG